MNNKPDQKSLFFLLFISLIVAISLFLSFYKYFIKQDFLIEAKIPCSPENESCFTEECDISDPRCLGNNGIYNFKIVTKKASAKIPLTECEQYKKCEVIYCDNENVGIYSSSDICL